MPWWLLLLLVVLTWCLWALAAAAERAADEAAERVPQDRRGGVSICPAIPVLPLVFFGAAMAADAFFPPWGTRAVATLHGLLTVLFLASIARDFFRLRSAETAD